MASRTGSVTAIMIGIAGLATLLALEAERSSRVHQATTERVLRDYAALGAEGVTTRLQALLSSRLYPILAAISTSLPASREELARDQRPGIATLVAGSKWAGRIEGSGALRAVRYDSTAVIDTTLTDSVRAVAARLPETAYFGMLVRGDEVIIFGPTQRTSEGVPVFALPLTLLRTVVGRFVTGDPVLPGSLVHGASLGRGIGVTVDLTGQTLAQRGETAVTRFAATDSLGAMYGGMTVEVRLAEALAPLLVIGGLPRSRLPFLVSVMALTSLLALVAVYQLRQKERLARLREDFVAGASHELRTPLAQIRLFAETLRLGRVRSDAERQHALGAIEREARRLEHLVENLLHFSRAERLVLAVAQESVDLGALTREIVTEFAPLAEKATVRVDVEGLVSLNAHVDPGAWRQIVLNLLDNAVKYGGQGTRVSVSLNAVGGWPSLSVADEGPGVLPGDATRVWQRFWRGEAARSAGTTGTGLGLATVRDLVELHGGKCWVEAAQPRGARFVVCLPGLA